MDRPRPISGTDGWRRSVNASAMLEAACAIVSAYGKDWPEGSPQPNVWLQIHHSSRALPVTSSYVADALLEKIERDMLVAPGTFTVNIVGRK